MRDAAKLWLWIFERGHRSPGIAVEIAHVIVRWFSRRLISGEQDFAVIVERRDDRLVGFGIAAEQTLSPEGLKIQPINERPIAVRGRTLAGEVDEIPRLHNHSGTATAKSTTATIAAHHRIAGIFVRCLLPAIPKLARRGAGLENPCAYTPRHSVGFA